MNTPSNSLPAQMVHSRHAGAAGIISSMTKLITYKVTVQKKGRTQTKTVRARSILAVLDQIGTRNNSRIEIVRITETR